jgi:pimeloyl-ACP methyl ester carboxylesterase
VVRHLAGVPVLTYDRRGYGRSIAMEPATGIDEHVADLLALLDEPSVVVGHSQGGNIALRAAVKEPDLFLAVGVWEPPTPWMPYWPPAAIKVLEFVHREDISDAADLLIQRMVGRRVWEAMPEETKDARRRETPALVNDVLSVERAEPWTVDSLKAIDVRLGYGTESWPHQQDATKRLAEALGVDAYVIEGARHGAHVTHAAQFADWVEGMR